MEAKQLAILISIVFICFWVYRKFHFSSNSINGIYVNNNTMPVLEGPSEEVDTLYLHDNFTFENRAWGKGTYKVKGDRITFNYEYEYGRAGYSTSLHRPLFGQTIRINLNSDLEFYYEKIR